MKRLFRTTAAAVIFALLLSIFAPAAFAASTQTLDAAQHNPWEIQSYAIQQGLNDSVGVNYTQLPSIDSPGAVGAVDQNTKNAFIAAMNTVRYIAGLDPIRWDDSSASATMAGAIVCTLNTSISHTPVQPAGLDYDIYSAGYWACNEGNLYMKTGGQLSALSSVKAWMDDSDAYNIMALGHRRWCLNPKMGKSSFGAINTRSGCYSVMDAFDTSNGSDNTKYVAWPATNMPVEFFGPSQAWSISVPNASSSARVTVVSSNGRIWNLDSSQRDGVFSINTKMQGTGDYIIFRPNGITTNPGDVYDVTVNNGSTTIQYTVTFFSMGMSLSGTGSSTIISGSSVKPGYIPTVNVSVSGNMYNAYCNLSWPGVEEADGYEVQMSYDNRSFLNVQTGSQTSYTINNFNEDTPYFFLLRAYKLNGANKIYGEYTPVKLNTNIQVNVPATDDPSTPSIPTAPKKPTKPLIPTDPADDPSDDSKPATVTGLKAVTAGSDSVLLTWNKATGADGYIVEKYNGSKYVDLGIVYDTSYTDTGLKVGVTYKYRVIAFNDTDDGIINGKASSAKSFKIAGPKPLAPARSVKAVRDNYTNANITWKPVTGADGYEIQKLDGKEFKPIGTVTGTSYRDTGLQPFTTYKYKIVAYKNSNDGKAMGKASTAATLKAVKKPTKPSAPAGIKPVQASNNSVNINWKPVKDAAGYEVFKLVDKTYVKIADIKDTNYTDAGLIPGGTYKYKIAAYKTFLGEVIKGRPSGAKTVKLATEQPA